MKKEFKRKGFGYDVFVDGTYKMWVRGTIEQAQEELENYLIEESKK